MIDTGDLTMYCHWDKGLVCKKEFYCDTCEHQPAADDKENGKAEPVHIRWAEDYWSGRYAVQLGAVCLLRSKVSARRAYGGMEQAAGGSSHGLPLLRRKEHDGRGKGAQQRTLSRSMYSLWLRGDGMKRSFYGTI